MKLLLKITVYVVLFLLVIRYLERNTLYYPMKEIVTTPGIVGLDYEEVYFKTDDNKRLHGWFIPNDDARFTIIFTHGNAGNISHRIEKIDMLHRLGLGIFIFDYRGYGKSEGRPSEKGLYKDVEAAYKYLTKKRGISGEDIIAYGESMGGVVAIHLAHKANVRAVITEEAFTSIRDMARTAYPFLPHFIFSSRFDALPKIKDVEAAKLIIHSIGDEIVPFRMGKRLFEAAGPPKKFLELRGSHNTAFLDSRKEFIAGIKAFLEDL